MDNTIKCVILGDARIGKTCLLVAYSTNEFHSSYEPTVFDNYMVRVKAGSYDYTLNVFDTGGREDCNKLRPLSYPNADIFLLCFSVVSVSSFSRIKTKWIREILPHTEDGRVPVVLVGTQIDLRNDGVPSVSRAEGDRLAKELNLFKYLECSALTQKGSKAVFDEAILAALKTPFIPTTSLKDKVKRNCVLL